MNLVNKLIYLLLYCLLVTEVFPQEKSYISTNGNIDNSFRTRSIYNISTFTPLKKYNSAEVLDSLICIYLSGNRIKIAYSYNNDLSLNYFTNAVWSNGEWITLDKHTNTYNSEGNLESVLWEWFNTVSQEWIKDAKDVYNYDSLENRIFHLHQIFKGQDFVNSFKSENCYDTANNLVSSVNLDWIDSKWVNRSRLVYSYTSENVSDTTLFQVWTNDQWVNYSLANYEYDEKLNINTSQTKIWQEQQWIDYALGKFDYDENNNLVLENWQMAVNNNWENWFRIFYEYDDNNNLIHLFGEEWENDQWVPENEPLKVTNPDGILYGYLAKEIFLYYSKPTDVGSEINIADGFNLLQNYPNPFNPTTTIKFTIPAVGRSGTSPYNAQLTIYDILGRKIATLVNETKAHGTYEIQFDGSHLPSGVYFYRLTAGGYSQTMKMILAK